MIDDLMQTNSMLTFSWASRREIGTWRNSSARRSVARMPRSHTGRRSAAQFDKSCKSCARSCDDRSLQMQTARDCFVNVKNRGNLINVHSISSAGFQMALKMVLVESNRELPRHCGRSDKRTTCRSTARQFLHRADSANSRESDCPRRGTRARGRRR